MEDIYDLQGVDVDDDDLNLDGAGWYGMIFSGLDQDGAPTSEDLGIFIKHLNFDESQAYGSTGTGIFSPFLNLNGGTTLRGFNLSSNTQQQNNDNGTHIKDPSTTAIQLKDIPIVYLDLIGDDGILEAYYVINLDINENTNLDVALSELQLFVSGSEATFADYMFDDDPTGLAFSSTDGYELVFDLDSEATGGDKTMILSDLGPGQGKQDYIFYFPVELFEDAGATGDSFLTLFSQFGPTPPDDAGFAEWNVLQASQIEGIKFNDLNGNGIQDGIEAGLEGFTMFIDLDGDGRLDANEQTAVSGSDGSFEFFSLLNDTDYVIYEVLTSDDIDPAYLASLGGDASSFLPTPPGDWILTTGDGSGGHLVAIADPGVYTVSVGNFLADPSISIDKEIPSITGGVGTNGLTGANDAGDVINYTISVTNDGNIDLTNVVVTDPNADPGSITREADIFGNNDDTLDVGEIWAYSATHTVTQDELDSRGDDSPDGPDNDIDNTATVDADWSIFGQSGSVSDNDSEDAPLIITPDIEVVKAVEAVTNPDDTPDEDGAIDEVGDTITYSITVSNIGNVTLTGVDVSDTLEGVDYDISGAVLVESGVANGLLDVGESWTYTFDVVATQTLIDENCHGDGDQMVTNSASVTAMFGNQQIGDGPSIVNTDVFCDPVLAIDKVVVSVDAGGDDILNNAGEEIVYAVTVTNDGNVTLTDVIVDDPLLGDLTGLNIGDLAPGESWNSSTDGGLTLSYTVTQNDFDSNATLEPDNLLAGFLDNTARADSNETDEVSDSEAVAIERVAAINVVKAVTSIEDDDDFGGTGQVDSAGDVINYSLTISNEGNYALSGVTMEDEVEAYGAVGATPVDDGFGFNIGDLDQDNLLDVDEVWEYTASYTVVQNDIDTDGFGNGFIDNVATGDTNETDPDTDDEAVPVVYAPDITVTKDVSVDQGAGYIPFDPADVPTGPIASLNSDPIFRVTVTNSGNVTLTGVTLLDTVNPEIGMDYVVDYAASAMVDTNDDGVGDISFTDWETANDGVADGDFDLGVGEDVTILYSIPFAVGQHENQVVATTDQGVSDDDFAFYFGLVNEGPGVRTPGFWQNDNNGLLYWDGIPDNQPHEGDEFPEGDLLYAVDSNNDGVIDDADEAGLLIGDFNMDGLSDGEDTLFIRYEDAVALVEHSETKGNDGAEKIGRDTVATWLNYLAGNNIGTDTPDPDVVTPYDYVQEAVDWLQTFSGESGNKNDTTETFDVYDPAAKVRSKDAAWKEGIDDDSPSGSEIHQALDSYNNDGSIDGVAYAGDADSAEFAAALSQIISVQESLALQTEALNFAADYSMEIFKDDLMLHQETNVIA